MNEWSLEGGIEGYPCRLDVGVATQLIGDTQAKDIFVECAQPLPFSVKYVNLLVTGTSSC